ncbi:MAG: HlyD family efflux transporter periplasmic adaptor subunit, partial [Hyphomonadaceae bacterium]|nr:HlyD family efflux transporter periplasmic adaptor subunit [Clostridia bacterium]
SKLPGRVQKITVKEGQEVKAGDLLVEIASEDIAAKRIQVLAGLSQAQAGYEAKKSVLSAAQAQLQKAQNGARPQEKAQAGIQQSTLQKSLNRLDEVEKNKLEQAKSLEEIRKGALDAAKAQAQKAENGARAQEIAQAQAAVDLWTKTDERVQKLFEKGAVSAQKRDEVKTQLLVATQTLSMAKEGARIEDKSGALALVAQAQAAYDQAVSARQEVIDTLAQKRDEVQGQLSASEQTVSMVNEGARVEDVQSASDAVLANVSIVEAAQGTIDELNGKLKEVDAFLNDCKIVAPMAGVVGTIATHEGELVSSGMSMMTISNRTTATVEVKVKETELKGIHVGQTCELKIPADANTKLTGTVVTINQKPDFATKRSTNDNGDFDIVAYGVKINIDNHASIVRPGMTVFVQFIK